MNTNNLESQLYTVDLMLASGQIPAERKLNEMAQQVPEDKRAFFLRRAKEKIEEFQDP